MSSTWRRCPPSLTRNHITAWLALFCSLAGLVTLAHADDAPGAQARTPVRGCETRVESEVFTKRQLPGFWRRRAVRAGPVVFLAGDHARHPASDFARVPGKPRRYYEQKLLLIVRAGAVATVVVPKRERERFALLYDRSKRDLPYNVGHPIAGGDRAVRFRACRESHPTFSGRGIVGAWTEFNGGVLVAGPQCAAIDVHTHGREKPVRRFLAFGVERESCPPRRPRRQEDAVLYGIGVSTDPYGDSRPQGIGVAARTPLGAGAADRMARPSALASRVLLAAS